MGRTKQAFAGEVGVDVGPVVLPGTLEIPEDAAAAVLFAHGSGSSRFSSRNRYVAEVLREAGLGTLLFDLLTEGEAADRANVFDIPLLAGRLAGAAEWLRRQPEWAEEGGLRIGYFGASTGAGAALLAAAHDPTLGAVVSRGGRPDLAGEALAHVRAPTRLIVGSNDEQVLELNRRALAALRCPSDLVVVPGATHLFEEPGALERAAELARDWFSRTL